MKVLITGAAGLIGRAAGNAFADAGWTVIGFDLRPSSEARFPLRVANLLNEVAWKEELAGCDAIVHLAGHADAGRVPDAQLLAENRLLNENVFAAADTAGVRRIVFASSCQVSSGMMAGPEPRLGLPPDYLPLDGEAPARPRNVYAQTKAEAELKLRTWCDGAAGRCAISVRFPWVMADSFVEEAMWYRTALLQQRDAFTFLTASEAGRFLVHAAEVSVAGYRCYYPAGAENLLLWPAEKVRRYFFPNTAVKGSPSLKALADLDVLERELGWRPRPLPQFAGVAGIWRKLRVLGWQQVSRRLPTARRRLREFGRRFAEVGTRFGPELGVARVVATAGTKFGECPVWDAANAAVWWVDLGSPRVLRTDVATGATQEYDAGDVVSAVGLMANGGGVWVARRHDLARLCIQAGITTVHPLTKPFEGAPNRLNDAQSDPAGRLWVGSMHVEGRPATGTLFRIGGDGQVERVLEGLGCPNGPAWSPDGRVMYLVNSAEGMVEAFDFDMATGGLSSRRKVVVFPSLCGAPDGLCVDQEGKLWVALNGGGKVVRVDPHRGKILGHVAVPNLAVTSCTLGGSDLRTLYVTGAGAGGQGGGLYAADVAAL
jgi:sugar lactone lactonase YvrE/nucleoside-diphosphate-sugar epimerase